MKMRRVPSVLVSLAAAALCGLMAAQAANADFTDVPSSHPQYEYIMYAADHGLVNGVGNNRFDPSSGLTRAQFVTILHRLDKQSGTTSSYGNSSFSDIPYGEWYSDAVFWAATNGITNGIGSNKFGPDMKLTMEQTATFVNRYIDKFLSGKITSQISSNLYKDDSLISDWARHSVYRLKMSGFTAYSGISYYFNPQSTATRGDGATILAKLFEKVSEVNGYNTQTEPTPNNNQNPNPAPNPNTNTNPEPTT